MIWLLFAFAYVFATASSVSLFYDRPWVHDFGSWIVIGFGMTYAVLKGVLESSRVAEPDSCLTVELDLVPIACNRGRLFATEYPFEAVETSPLPGNDNSPPRSRAFMARPAASSSGIAAPLPAPAG